MTKVWKGNEDLRRLLVPLGELRTHPRNPRRGDVSVIRASLERFGQQSPSVALPDGTLVKGNHTFLAAAEAGWTHLAAVRSNLSDEEAEAYLAADNRTSDLGAYDKSELAALLNDLESRQGLEGTGYTRDDLRVLLAEVGRSQGRRGDPEAVPDKPAEPKSEPGAVYELGPHLLVCGDATNPDVYESFGEDADLMWTDPPYGVDYTGKTKEALKIRGDKAEQLQQLLNDTFEVAALADGRSWYIASPAGPMHGAFLRAIEYVNWRLHETLIWVKDTMVLGHSDYHYQHEPILYGFTPGVGRPGRGKHQGSRWFGDNAQTTVLPFDRPKRSEEHPTMKPVALVEQCLQNSSRPSELVLDPFAGSGSTLIACESLGRRAALVEIDPVYCDVIRQRYADYVGDPQLAP